MIIMSKTGIIGLGISTVDSWWAYNMMGDSYTGRGVAYLALSSHMPWLSAESSRKGKESTG